MKYTEAELAYMQVHPEVFEAWPKCLENRDYSLGVPLRLGVLTHYLKNLPFLIKLTKSKSQYALDLWFMIDRIRGKWALTFDIAGPLQSYSEDDVKEALERALLAQLRIPEDVAIELSQSALLEPVLKGLIKKEVKL